MRSSRFGKRLGGAFGLVLSAAVLASTLTSAATETQVVAAKQDAVQVADQQVDSSSFQNLNGFMWFYNTYFDYKFSDIEDDLRDLKSRGIRVLGFFSPYNGGKHWCDGCAPYDFYSVPPQNGTMEDWESLVEAAHKLDMKVVAYFANIYMDEDGLFFRTAEQQYAAGDRTSREVASFRWTDDPTDPLPRLQNAPPAWSKWEFSEEAGAYYWKLWFGPGFDFDLPGARAELERIEKFWLDTGLDGFMWDVGRVDEAMRYFAVELPKTYTSNDKWLTYERGGSASADAFAEFGLNAWFNGQDTDTVNDYTRILDGTTDANGLEAGLANADRARELGATTHTWSIWGDEEFANLIPHQYPAYPNDEVMRVQEAALLAGAGIHYGAGMYDQYVRWSPKLRSNWERVLRTVNANKALLPSADRVRVPAGPDPKTYAMRRTSEDGRQTALLIYNFNSTATNVTVDLTGTGIGTRQVPKDLYNGGRTTAINGTSYTVRLPAYGFTILEVSASKPPPEPVVFDFSPSQIAVPTDRALWPAFREQAREWRAQQIKELDYTGPANAAATEWMSETFLIAHTQLNDLTLLDTETNTFTVDNYLDLAEEQHGGYDMLLLWHAHMNLGTDNRNQWDYFRDQPGGLEGLATMIDEVHARGVKVALTYLPWDTGTRREDSWTGDNAANDYEMLIEMTKALDADIIFLDTLSSVNTLRALLDAEGLNHVVLETEFEPTLANMDDSGIQASLYVTEEEDRKLELSRNKWFDRRYIEHVLKEQTSSNQDKTADIHGAFFNGNGIELIENQYQLPAMTDERSSSLLRAMLPIQRRYAAMFRDNENVDSWTPLIDTNNNHLYGSLWADADKGNRLWTLVNTSETAISGDLITVDHVRGQKYYDLISGKELKPAIDDGKATLRFAVSSRGIMGIVAGTRPSLGRDFNAFLASQAEVNRRATDSTEVRQFPEQLEPVDETPAYTPETLPADMIQLAPADDYPINIKVGGIRSFGQPGFQFRGRGTVLPYFDTPLERTVDIAGFAIDEADVTNAQYKEFLDATDYTPAVYDNFLKHWEADDDGRPVRPVPGTEGNPVVYVSSKDALAYAEWAGKRLPTQEEFTYAMEQAGDKAMTWPAAPHRVWNMTSSIRSSAIARSMLLKGGTSYVTGVSPHYADSYRDTRITNFDWVARFELGAEGINRQETIGFRLAADLG